MINKIVLVGLGIIKSDAFFEKKNSFAIGPNVGAITNIELDITYCIPMLVIQPLPHSRKISK